VRLKTEAATALHSKLSPLLEIRSAERMKKGGEHPLCTTGKTVESYIPARTIVHYLFLFKNIAQQSLKKG
jgi:hypothetical protein